MVSYKILLISDSTLFKLFFPHIRRHYWGTYRSAAQVFVYRPDRMRPAAMLATADSVIEWSAWNVRKVQGQIRNCETSVVTHSTVDITHQITIHQRRTPTSRLTVHVLPSFTEHPNPTAIWCHKTHYVHIDGHDRYIEVILAKHCIELQEYGSFVIRNMLEKF